MTGVQSAQRQRVATAPEFHTFDAKGNTEERPTDSIGLCLAKTRYDYQSIFTNIIGNHLSHFWWHKAALTMKQWEPISKWKEDTIEIGHKCCWLAKLLQSKVYRRRDNHVYFFRYATILYIKYTQLLSSFKSSYRIGWQPSGLRVNRKLVIGWDDRVLNFCAFVLIFGHHTKDSSTCNGEKQYVIRYFGNTLFKVDEMFMVLLQVIGWSRDITARRRGEYY